jgi:acyl dehydratase
LHTVTEKDVQTFADLTGDDNPLHMDEQYAAQTRFKHRVVHGMLTASFLSTLIGTLLPGRGALYLSQELNFKKPVMINDIIEAKVVVVQKIAAAKMLVLETTITNQHSQVVVEGKAKVMWATNDPGAFK